MGEEMRRRGKCHESSSGRAGLQKVGKEGEVTIHYMDIYRQMNRDEQTDRHVFYFLKKCSRPIKSSLPTLLSPFIKISSNCSPYIS